MPSDPSPDPHQLSAEPSEAEPVSPRPRRRRRSALITAAAMFTVVLIGGAAVVAVRGLLHSASPVRSEQCSFGSFTLSNDQTSVAAQMVAVVVTRALPERASVLALAAAYQESKLTDLPGGDRDSVGVLQQRPSQGWGTVTQIMNIRYATGKFLDALVKVPNWQTGDLADTIQAVQISADGSAYAPHEPMAQALANALMGVTPAGLTCYYTDGTATTPSELAAAVSGELPVNTPVAQADGITVPGASWTTAAWFVANAQRFAVTSVTFSGQRWTPAAGWKSDSNAGADRVSAGVGKS